MQLGAQCFPEADDDTSPDWHSQVNEDGAFSKPVQYVPPPHWLKQSDTEA